MPNKATDRLDSHPSDLKAKQQAGTLPADAFSDSSADSVAGLQPVTIASLAVAAPAQSAAVPEEFGDYELLEEIGRGGMGRVYKARQKSLNRLVALKMIVSGRNASDVELRRFRVEAAAAAQLEHPVIVPIYEVGEHDGHAYFSMKFVEGGSLDRHLPRFQKDNAGAARILAAVARGVHEAHRHGILHRDLKPANILLDPNGQPHITDFGLAKRVGRPEEVSPHGIAVAPSHSLTQCGAIMGTPNYMAPEQADPRLGPTTTAADVYGLGAILYALLTGKPPFRGETVFDTLIHVVTERPPAPRSLNARVNRDLEFICLKCLEKKPDHRYASAEALADDLERWLAGKPIQARPVGGAERVFKWARRRPAAAALIVVSVAAVLALTVGGLWYGMQLRIALADARKGREAAEHEEQRAERHFRLAVDAVEELVRQMEDDDLPPTPAVERMRQTVLLDALRFNQQFLVEKSDDPGVRHETGRAYRRAGDIYRLLGRLDHALAAYDDAAHLLEDSTTLEDRRELALTEHNRGILLEVMGSFDPAEESLRQALELREQLAADFPDVAEQRRELARTRGELGRLFAETGRLDEAETLLRQAMSVSEASKDEADAAPREQLDLARSLGILGRLLADNGKPIPAEEAFRRAVALCQTVYDKKPDDPQYRVELARARGNLGAMLWGNGRSATKRGAEAEQELKTARTLCEKLAADFANVPEYRQELARSLTNVALLYRDDKDESKRQQADELFNAALDLRKQLVQECPTVHRYRQELARSHNFIGKLMDSRNRLKEGEEAYRTALDLERRLTAEQPNVPQYRNDLGVTLNNLGEFFQHQKDWKQAREFFETAIVSVETALQSNRRNPTFRRELVRAYDHLAVVLTRQNNHAALVEKATALRSGKYRGPEIEFTTACLLARAVPLIAKDEALAQSERTQRSEAYAVQAVQCLREGVRLGLKDANRLKTAPGLASLRKRDDFQTLVKKLEAANPPAR